MYSFLKNIKILITNVICIYIEKLKRKKKLPRRTTVQKIFKVTRAFPNKIGLL